MSSYFTSHSVKKRLENIYFNLGFGYETIKSKQDFEFEPSNGDWSGSLLFSLFAQQRAQPIANVEVRLWSGL